MLYLETNNISCIHWLVHSLTHSLTHSHTHSLFLPRRENRRYLHCCCGCCTFAIIAAVTVASLIIAFSVHPPDKKLTSYDSVPGDTHLFSSFSSTYCKGLTISGDTGAVLYLLDQKPSLSGSNSLVANTPGVVEAGTYRYLKLYLYTGSSLNMTYCDRVTTTPVTFFLIKGSENWDCWKDDKNSSHSEISLDIDNECDIGGKILRFYFNSTDYYYFVFNNPNPLKDSIIEIVLWLHRTEYVITDNKTIVSSCEKGIPLDCTAPVPYRPHLIALLSINEDLYANFNVDLLCKPRVWVYVIIVSIPLLFLVVIVFSVCVLSDYMTSYMCVCRRRAGYLKLNHQPQAHISHKLYIQTTNDA